MNKIWLFGAAFCMMLAFGSCKSKQSVYKAAYEKARDREMPDAPVVEDELVEEEVIAPVSKPRTSGAAVRQERVTPVAGENADGLKQYSVVIGSFKNKTNATSLKERMQNDGYTPILAQNEQGMYRVIITSFDYKADAADSRDAIKAKYAPNFQDAWILQQQN